VRHAKHILFVAGVLGMIAMFMPLFSLGKNLSHVEVSARDLSFGLKRTHALLDSEIPARLQKSAPAALRKQIAEVASARDDIRQVLDALRGSALAFIPSALILLIGVLGFWRGGDLARWLAAVAVLCGLASIAAYFGLVYGIDYGKNEEPLLERVHLTVELGAYMLIAVGLGGIAGGIVGLVGRRGQLPGGSGVQSL